MDRIIWELVYQGGQNYMGTGVSVKRELYGTWCVGVDRIIWELVCQ